MYRIQAIETITHPSPLLLPPLGLNHLLSLGICRQNHMRENYSYEVVRLM